MAPPTIPSAARSPWPQATHNSPTATKVAVLRAYRPRLTRLLPLRQYLPKYPMQKQHTMSWRVASVPASLHKRRLMPGGSTTPPVGDKGRWVCVFVGASQIFLLGTVFHFRSPTSQSIPAETAMATARLPSSNRTDTQPGRLCPARRRPPTVSAVIPTITPIPVDARRLDFVVQNTALRVTPRMFTGTYPPRAAESNPAALRTSCSPTLD
jgi:hypothetical protein